MRLIRGLSKHGGQELGVISSTRAIIFDVDGTLYDQSLLRYRMLRQLVHGYWAAPREGLRAARVLSAYRKALEELRTWRNDIHSPGLQIEVASRRSGVPIQEVVKCVERWFVEAPLSVLPDCLYEGVLAFLEAARRSDIVMGIFSDYDATEKLRRLRIHDYFSVIASACDPEIQRYKPNPRGLEIVLKRLDVNARDAVYIGDRPEIDAEAASRASMRAVVMGKGSPRNQNWIGARDYFQLSRMFALDTSR